MRQALADREVARRERDEAARVRLVEALPALVQHLVLAGAKGVWLFGSLAWGRAGGGSDIDLAVEGLPPQAHFRVQGELLMRAPGRVDLVRLEDVEPDFARRIVREGRRLDG